MNTLAIFDVSSPTPIASADVVGDLNLVQRQLLKLNPTAFMSLYTTDIFNFTLALNNDPSQLSWSNVMRKYNQRACKWRKELWWDCV